MIKDIKQYITCKRWREAKEKQETKNEKEDNSPLQGGSRLDTTLAVCKEEETTTKREEKGHLPAKEDNEKGDNTTLQGGGADWTLSL